MKSKNNAAVYLFFLFIFLFVVFTATTMISFDVSGANNSITITKVNVINTEPNLYYVFVTPASINLEPGNTTKINCTGYVSDPDGYQDVTTVNATFYDSSNGDTGGFDGAYRYLNSSGTCVELSTYNASCSCLFDVQYYANNGTWQCNMTIADDYGVSDNENSTYYDVNTVVGINVPAELDYGNLSVTQYSLEKGLNITNYGNVPINISVRGYGGTTDPTNPDNLSMICASGSNISMEYEKYTLTSGIGYESMTTLNNESVEMGFAVDVKSNDAAVNNLNTTYWMIYIPASVSGFCNGTLEFVGHENPQ